MIDERALRKAFSEYAEALLSQYRIGDVLYRLTDQVVEVLGLAGAGVSLGHGDETLRFVTASGEQVSRLEDEQIALGDGPCWRAFHSGDVITSSDLKREERWEPYVQTALEQGFRSVAAIPMPVGRDRIGALDMYDSEPRDWKSETLEVGQLLANVASGYVLNAWALEESRTLSGQLQNALDSRIVIEQAKGMVAAKQDIEVNVAFELLRREARNRSMRLHEFCRRVVEGEEEL